MKKKISVLAVILLAVIAMAFSGSVTIKGTVTDENGHPLPGVNVVIKGTRNGTLTDQHGRYMITSVNEIRILVFSYSGYSTVEVTTGNRSTINVIMKQELKSLQEAVIVGYAAVADRSRQSHKMPASASVIGYSRQIPYGRFNRNFNTEGYAPINENGFRNVKASPLSTFSIDVDHASYSNIRRFINNGGLPPADAVRIEEMINYFRYDYPLPDDDHPFSLSTEMTVCPWNRSHYLLQVGLRGKDINKSGLPPSNIVFLIDVSGSMNSPDKLPLLKSAFGLLVNELRPQDRVAIVVYAGAAGLVLESTPGNRKEKIMCAIDKLEAGGSTAGGAGLKLAYKEAENNFIEGGNNRIILATDGDFNVGESSNGAMERLVEEERDKGVYITVLGFGMGNLKDDKMELIADKGNGNYSYIDNLREARKVLVSEFGGTLFTIARDVKFQIEFNPAKVKSYRLIGYENRLLNDEDFNDDRKDAGEMGAGHNVTALYELVPEGADETVPSVDPLRYQVDRNRFPDKKDLGREYLTIKVRYKKPDGSKSILMEKHVSGRIGDLEEASDNIRFAAAVAEFGMILEKSEYSGNSTLESSAGLARSARGTDEDGYRSELIRLINTVRSMKVFTEREKYE